MGRQVSPSPDLIQCKWAATVPTPNWNWNESIIPFLECSSPLKMKEGERERERAEKNSQEYSNVWRRQKKVRVNDFFFKSFLLSIKSTAHVPGMVFDFLMRRSIRKPSWTGQMLFFFLNWWHQYTGSSLFKRIYHVRQLSLSQRITFRFLSLTHSNSVKTPWNLLLEQKKNRHTIAEKTKQNPWEHHRKTNWAWSNWVNNIKISRTPIRGKKDEETHPH